VIGWFAGIGQDYVLATPLQMANVAATIARDGVWVRPSLLSSDQPPVATSPGALGDGPARVDLQMPPEAIKAAKLGMFRVVNSLAGTGTGLIAGDPLLASAMVAGKTGTAQASRMRVQKRDDSSHVIHDENGKPVYEFLEPSTVEKPNPDALWYRGSGHENKDLAHSWYIGFAPVDHPQIAFAVMVEYGGSGGVAAASVAREAIEGCIMRHYLTVKPPDVAAGSFDR
jgi:penicillin-binding protein 2